MTLAVKSSIDLWCLASAAKKARFKSPSGGVKICYNQRAPAHQLLNVMTSTFGRGKMTKIASAENIRARLWDRGNEVECEV